MITIHKHCHLTYDDRLTIQQALESNTSMKDISILLHKDNSTISKEIKKHRFEHFSYSPNSNNKLCSHFDTCSKTNICPKHDTCDSQLCKRCILCRSVCKAFCPTLCHRLTRAPHVCNGCQTTNCKKRFKYFYQAKVAQKEYDFDLHDSRLGINISVSALCRMDELLSPLLMDNRQPLSHILATHSHEFPCTIRTVYTYIEKGYIAAKNIDLPRKIRYKSRTVTKYLGRPAKKNLEIRKGRTYLDYLDYLKENPNSNIIEMDCVEGTKGKEESVLLTLLILRTNLQLAYKLPAQTAQNVSKVFACIYQQLGKDLFQELFAIILTDNGSEFTDVQHMENLGCKVFFCDPCASHQKGACENNHAYIRRYISKGKSFNNYQQCKIEQMMSHINSIKRPNLHNKSPYEITSFIWGKGVLDSLHVESILPDEVIINISLL